MNPHNPAHHHHFQISFASFVITIFERSSSPPLNKYRALHLLFKQLSAHPPRLIAKNFPSSNISFSMHYGSYRDSSEFIWFFSTLLFHLANFLASSVCRPPVAISQIQEFVETSIVLKKDKNNELGISIIGGSDTYLVSSISFRSSFKI